jgi:hypothetical protein
MQFVQASFLAAAAAVAIPIIVHLMFRSQARRVNLGTLRFLKQVLERNAQRQRLMRWLLLALRMAAVAILAMLFARPYFLEASLSGDRKLLLILLDRSATMDLKGEQGRLIEEAVAACRALIQEQSTQTQVEIAWFDQHVHPLGTDAAETAAGGNRDSVMKLLDAWKPETASFRGTNYGAALAWARDLAIRVPAAKQELHLYTDLQQSGLDWTEVEPLPAEVRVHVHDLGRAVVRNIAVIEARPIRTAIRPGESTTVVATLLNSSAFPIAEQPVSLKLESPAGKVALKQRLKLEAGSTGTVTFDVPNLQAGLWVGTVIAETDDDLSFDNTRPLAIQCADPYPVLVADGRASGTALLSSSYFLTSALRLAGPEEAYAQAPFAARVVPLSLEETLPALDGYRVVVLVNPGDMRPGDATRLREYLKAGGSLVVFCGDQTTDENTKTMADAGLLPGRLTGPQIATDLPYRLQSWESGHSIWRPFNDPQHGDLRRLSFRSITKAAVTPTETLKVLASFRSGEPALIEQQWGLGVADWWMTSCDRSGGEWPGAKLFVPMIHQLVGEPLGLNDGGPIRPQQIGTGPDQADVAAPAVIEHPGYWNVATVSPRESETDRTTVEEFADRFQFTLAEAESIAQQPVKVNRGDLRQNEQWPFAALITMALLLLETFVANRTVS